MTERSLYRRAVGYADRGRWHKARTTAAQALAEVPEDPLAASLVLFCDARAGLVSQVDVIGALDTLIAAHPGVQVVARRAAVLRAAEGDPEGAVRQLESLAEQGDGGTRLNLNIGLILNKIEPERAWPYLRLSAQSEDVPASARCWLMRQAVVRGDHETRAALSAKMGIAEKVVAFPGVWFGERVRFIPALTLALGLLGIILHGWIALLPFSVYLVWVAWVTAFNTYHYPLPRRQTLALAVLLVLLVGEWVAYEHTSLRGDLFLWLFVAYLAASACLEWLGRNRKAKKNLGRPDVPRRGSRRLRLAVAASIFAVYVAATAAIGLGVFAASGGGRPSYVNCTYSLPGSPSDQCTAYTNAYNAWGDRRDAKAWAAAAVVSVLFMVPLTMRSRRFGPTYALWGCVPGLGTVVAPAVLILEVFGFVGIRPPKGSSPDVHFSQKGRRFLIGFTNESFAIWGRERPGPPVERFAHTDEGWRQTWSRFVTLEGAPGSAKARA